MWAKESMFSNQVPGVGCQCDRPILRCFTERLEGIRFHLEGITLDAAREYRCPEPVGKVRGDDAERGLRVVAGQQKTDSLKINLAGTQTNPVTLNVEAKKERGRGSLLPPTEMGSRKRICG